MAISKKLEIIYHNGQPDGIRSIRRHLSTMTTYVIPRPLLSEAKKLTGINRPGIASVIDLRNAAPPTPEERISASLPCLQIFALLLPLEMVRPSSSQAPYHSSRRKRQDSFTPPLLLSPQNLRFCGASS